MGQRVWIVALALAAMPSVHGAAQFRQNAPRRTGLIVGQVIDASSGTPVSGAVVRMSGGSYFGPRLLTGADGRFVYRDLEGGSYTISAAKPGYVAGAAGRRRPAGPAQPIVLAEGARFGSVVVRMWKHASISGSVVDEAGEPLVGVQVRAFRRAVVSGRRRFIGGAVTATDDRGMYRAANLIPGDYVVATSARDMAVPLSVAEDMQVRTYPPAVALGPVSLPGNTASIQLGDFVYALGRGAAIPPPPANDRLLVYPTTFYSSALLVSQATPVTIGSGEERTAIDLQIQPVPTARITGTVSGPDGPSQSLVLQLVPAAADDVALAPDAPVTVSDRRGRFAFAAVPAGQYLLRASVASQAAPGSTETDGSLWVEQPLTVGRADIDGVTLALQAGMRIAGQLEFDGALPVPRGNRLQETMVQIEPANAMPGLAVPTSPVRVDASGQFISAALPPGKYLVRVVSSPAGWVFRTATYNGRDVTDSALDLATGDASGVTLTFTDRPSGLRGVVTSRRGTPDSDAIVLVFPTDAQAWTDYGLNVRRVGSARTSTTGQYSVTPLPPGDYYAAAIADDQAVDWEDAEFLSALASVAMRVRVAEGQQRTFDLHTRDVR